MAESRVRYSIGVTAAAVIGGLWLPVAQSHDVHYSGRAIGAFGTINAASVTKSITLADVPMSCSGTAREETVSSVSNPSPIKLTAKTVNGYAIGRDNVSATKAGIEEMHLETGDLKVDATGLTSHAEARCDEATLKITTSGDADVGSLVINGQGQQITGEPNQVIEVPGIGSIIVNEQLSPSTREKLVYALHVKVADPSFPANGDLYFAQSRSKITCSNPK
jgi:hypothetical protein